MKKPTKSSKKQFLRVGVTGGIGSGKSTLCEMLASFGRTVLSADDIGRGLTNTNNEIKSRIRATFGDEVFLPDGTPDRKRLAEVVFRHLPSRKKLNAIIHPRVFSAIESTLSALSPEQLQPYAVIEAALMYETEMHKELDYIVVVTAEEETRIRRVMGRYGESREHVVSRMRSQMDPAEQIRLAEFVVENNGSVSELAERAAFIDNLLGKIGSQIAPQ